MLGTFLTVPGSVMKNTILWATALSSGFYSLDALADGGMTAAIVFILPFLAGILSFVVGLITLLICRNVRLAIRSIMGCMAAIGVFIGFSSFIGGLADGNFVGSFVGLLLIISWLLLFGVIFSVIFFTLFWGVDSQDDELETEQGRENGEVIEQP